MSNLGGIPALFIVIGAMFCIWKMIRVTSTGAELNEANMASKTIKQETPEVEGLTVAVESAD